MCVNGGHALEPRPGTENAADMTTPGSLQPNVHLRGMKSTDLIADLSVLCHGQLEPMQPTEEDPTRGWAMAGACPAASLVVAPNTRRITWFLRVLKDVWSAQGILLRSAYVRPDSGAVRVWTRCLPWRWTRWRHQAVETWLREHLPAGVVQRGGVGIQALPVAKVGAEFIAQNADRQHGLHRWFQAA